MTSRNLNKIKSGFTLIELMVVVSIVGSLSSIALTSMTNVRSKARDTVRVQYIRQINEAITRYSWDHQGFYPPQDDPGNGGGGVLPNGFNESYDTGFISALVTGGYVSQVPRDPINDVGGTYHFSYLNSDGNVGGVALQGSRQNNFMNTKCTAVPKPRVVLVFRFETGPSSAYSTAVGNPAENVICYR